MVTGYDRKPSQAEINESLGEGHRPLLSYNELPDKDKDKPSVDSIDYMPNVRYLEAVKELGKKLGDQDIHHSDH
jgi:hypothetical protein